MVSSLTGGLKFWEDCLFKENEKNIYEKKQNTKKKNLLERYGPPPAISSLSLEEKIQVALGICDECIKPQELKELFETTEHPVCYDGFEPSGRMHIAQAVMKATIVNELSRCGCIYVFFIADWFAFLNNKLDGDLKKIKLFGEYFIEIWKSVGMNLNNVRFIWASEEINKCCNEYWLRVIDISRLNTITRIKRCCQIMGRVEGDDQPAASILYPCMQCSDIFQLQADICQLGMDQRKVNMLAREYAEAKQLKKPVILSHKMLPGLNKGDAKMSKSNPESAIYVDDSPQEVNRKIKSAYCVPQQLEENPCISYVENMILPWFKKFSVERKEENGGDCEYFNVEEFRNDYMTGKLHPGDLKLSLAKHLNLILNKIRNHFETDQNAKKLLKQIENWKK